MKLNRHYFGHFLINCTEDRFVDETNFSAPKLVLQFCFCIFSVISPGLKSRLNEPNRHKFWSGLKILLHSVYFFCPSGPLLTFVVHLGHSVLEIQSNIFCFNMLSLIVLKRQCLKLKKNFLVVYRQIRNIM